MKLVLDFDGEKWWGWPWIGFGSGIPKLDTKGIPMNTQFPIFVKCLYPIFTQIFTYGCPNMT